MLFDFKMLMTTGLQMGQLTYNSLNFGGHELTIDCSKSQKKDYQDLKMNVDIGCTINITVRPKLVLNLHPEDNLHQCTKIGS